MPLIFSNDRLLDVMNQWHLNNTRGAVILVDEDNAGPDVSRDREVRHRMQTALLVRAAGFGFPVFLVQFGPLPGASGQHAVFNGGLGPQLDAVIHGGTEVYKKGPGEADGFANVQLVMDVQNANITDVIIMGQSVNHCCAATARGAAALGLNVHTCESVIRGGNTATVPPDHQVFPYIGVVGWPNNATIYAAL
jgi:nicotinamidase-related amidase